MDEEKPFACTLNGCEMKFVNEDHLTVHKQKHELSLSLTPSSGYKPFFDDQTPTQTPTPSTFITALETDLFTELHTANPFDATFRRANSLVASTGEIPTISENTNSNTESLNTPSIILPVEDPVLPSAQLKTGNALKHNLKPTNNISEIPSKIPKLIQANKNESLVENDLGKNAIFSPITLSVNQNLNNRNAVVQTPVITSVGNLAKMTTGVPTAVVVTRASSNNVTTLNSSVTQIPVMTDTSHSVITTNVPQTNQSMPISSVLQLVIRLADGQTMPVSLPLAVASENVLPATKSINPNELKPIPSAVQKIPVQSYVKKKLKEVLKVQTNPVSSLLSDETSALLLNCQQESESPPSSPHAVGRPNVNARRRRTLDDADERRRKSRERNRAAATRCRQKRKQWISSLESKAAEMQEINAHLQNEVQMLRNEVAQLKTMLLAHKDCPVTQQQKASGLNENTLASHVSTIHKILLPSECDISSKQNVSEPLVELIECENSSSQSGYISENSEISSRDR